jgi:hypothetical protein
VLSRPILKTLDSSAPKYLSSSWQEKFGRKKTLRVRAGDEDTPIILIAFQLAYEPAGSRGHAGYAPE